MPGMYGEGQSGQDRAQARQQALLRKADTDAKRIAAADQALAQGNVRVAGLIYVRLAVRRPASTVTEQAKQRLVKLQAEARKKLEELDKALPTAAARRRPASARSARRRALAQAKAPDKGAASDTPEKAADADQPAEQPGEAADSENGRIVAIFREYDRLVAKYGELPQVGQEIKGHVAKLRHQPEYAVILNEPAATALLKVARQYEHDHHLCCAYWTYKQAAELVPAPSAVVASDRYDELRTGHEVVASAAACREMKWCHQAYLRAERVKKLKPENAKEIFAEIVRRAPEDSEVYRAAKEEMQ